MAMMRLSYDRVGTLVAARSWAAMDIDKFMHALHKRMGDRLLAYAWVLEVYASGDPHYHVLIVFRGVMPFRPDESGVCQGRRFKRLWPYGATHVDYKIRSVYYIGKYTGKEYQKDFLKYPDGAHAFAVWIGDKGYARVLGVLTLSALSTPGRRWQFVGVLSCRPDDKVYCLASGKYVDENWGLGP